MGGGSILTGVPRWIEILTRKIVRLPGMAFHAGQSGQNVTLLAPHLDRNDLGIRDGDSVCAGVGLAGESDLIAS